MEASPFITPAASPMEAVSMRDGLGANRSPRHSSNTEARITPPIASRTELAPNAVSIMTPIGMPSTIPGLSPHTARQLHRGQALRSPMTPTITCSTTTNGTTLAGGSTRLSSGTAARPNPKPVKPRSSAAANTPNIAITSVSTIVSVASAVVSVRVQARRMMACWPAVIRREAAMLRDAHGLEVTAASAAVVQAFDHALVGYLSYRADMPQRMTALLEADPEFGLAHCLKGYLTMLAYKQAAVPIATAAAADAARLTAHAAPRERAHVAALWRWIDGEPDRAADIWEQILAEHPRDI